MDEIKYQYVPENDAQGPKKQVVRLSFKKDGTVWIEVGGYVVLALDPNGDAKVVPSGFRLSGLTLDSSNLCR